MNRGKMPDHNRFQRRVYFVAVGLLFSGLICHVDELFAQRRILEDQRKKIGDLKRERTGGKLDVETDGVFLPMQRMSARRLEKAKLLIDQGRFGEAVLLLDTILSSDEDWFFSSERDHSNYRSLKAEARRLIGELPSKGLEMYRLQFGPRAKKMLDAAVAVGDVAVLADVSRQFFHTRAGYEATLMLGNYHLDHARPLAAAISFQQLLDTSSSARLFDPTLSVQAAFSWTRAGREDRARKTLIDLKKRYPGTEVRIADRQVPLFTHEATCLAWLEEVVGPQLPNQPDRLDDWMMHRGNAARNGPSAGGQPLLTPRWRVRTTNRPTIEKLIQHMQQAYLSHKVAALPAAHPLAIGDMVFMRTVRNLVAIDLRTGKRKWELTPDSNDQFDHLINVSRDRPRSGSNIFQLGLGLEQRMWDDATYGTLSSDGERVYAVRGLELLSNPRSGRMFFMGMGRRRVRGLPGGTGPSAYNRLVALDVAARGEQVWEVGGPKSVEPELTEAFFLGPPLALGGQLYVLAEIKSGIRMVVLDATTGRQLWSQQLADLERNIVHDPVRRYAGATPSFSDGVLVCPTSAGAVVAVDLTGRSLLWAYKYSQKFDRKNAIIMRRYPIDHNRLNDRWIDAAATLAEGQVLLSPVESNELHCLNLIDGEVVWTKDRGKNLYVACVHDGKVVLVGREKVTAVKLTDGALAWPEPTPLPQGSMPSGRGYFSKGYYYVPLSSAEVAKIDLNDGQIVARTKSRYGQIPGNLICHKDHVISQGTGFVEAYYQMEPLVARVRVALERNPGDAEAIARQGEISLEDGRLGEAVAHFRRSFELDSNELTRELLVESLLEALRVDFAANHEAVPHLERLIDRPEQRVALLRLVARGFEQTGKLQEAFQAYLQLVDLEDETTGLIDVSPILQVRADRLIQAHLASLRRTASSEIQAEMDAAIQQRLEADGPEGSPARLRRSLEFFGAHPAADSVRLRLARHMLDSHKPIECESYLRQLERSEQHEYRGAAVAMQAELLHQTRRYRDAAQCYTRLEQEWPDVPCLDGKTGSEIVAALSEDDPVRRELELPKRWPEGTVEVSSQRVSQSSLLRRRYPLPLRGDRGPFFTDMTISIDQRSPQSIVGHDGLGTERFRLQINPPRTSQRNLIINPTFNYGAVSGHLLLVSMGYQILAIDTLSHKGTDRSSILWRHDLTEQIPGIPRPRSIRPKQINIPGGLPRYRAEDYQGRPIGILGPILSHGITFQRFGDLICVDPITGQTNWIRRNLPVGSDLFGDDELLFVVPPNTKKEKVEAVVLRPLDGKQLGSRTVGSISPKRKRMMAKGRHVLEWVKLQEGIELVFSNPWEQTKVWSRRFSATAKIWLLENEAVGVLERDGNFVLIYLHDGKPLIDQQLEPEPRLSGIYMIQSRDQILLFTNRQTTSRRSGRSVSPVSSGFNHPLISGHVYAFDRRTGKSQWPVPAQITECGLSMTQPTELPMLAFVQQVAQKRRSNSQRKTTTSVLCIDKRTGKPLYQKADLPRTGGVYALQSQPDKNLVTLALPTTTVKLMYSDVPAPPEPPLQANEGQFALKRKGLKFFKFLGAIPKAIEKVAEDFQDEDPFGLELDFEDLGRDDDDD